LLSFLLAPLFPFVFFPHTSTTDIYTLSLHDALPIFFTISCSNDDDNNDCSLKVYGYDFEDGFYDTYTLYCYDTEGNTVAIEVSRSEEHTSELQSRENLVCRLLLEKKKK